MTQRRRIAVCSSDGRMVDEHFGTTQHFLILESVGDSVNFVEWRATQPSCTERRHDSSASARNVALIADCQVLLTVRAGPPVLAKLLEAGIDVQQGSASIAEAVERIVASGRVATKVDPAAS